MQLQDVLHRAALSMALGLCIANLANAAPCDDAGNVLTDPSFEKQTPADRGGWVTFGGLFSTEYARSGIWSMLNAAAFDVVGSYEQIPAAPGSRWRLTGYGFAPAQLVGSPAGGLLQVTFFDAAGNDLGTVETAGQQFPAKTSEDLNSSTPVNIWILLDTGTATAPAGAAFIQAFTLYIDFSGNSYQQRVFFDDLNLQVLGVTHGGYVSSIALNAAALRRAGLITAVQQEAMVEAAARSNGGMGCTTGDQ
jgi:hypothetical protein